MEKQGFHQQLWGFFWDNPQSETHFWRSSFGDDDPEMVDLLCIYRWGFPWPWGYPKNGWFLLGKMPLKWMIGGVPLFQETTIYMYIYFLTFWVNLYVFTYTS